MMMLMMMMWCVVLRLSYISNSDSASSEAAFTKFVATSDREGRVGGTAVQDRAWPGAVVSTAALRVEDWQNPGRTADRLCAQS